MPPSAAKPAADEGGIVNQTGRLFKNIVTVGGFLTAAKPEEPVLLTAPQLQPAANPAPTASFLKAASFGLLGGPDDPTDPGLPVDAPTAAPAAAAAVGRARAAKEARMLQNHPSWTSEMDLGSKVAPM